MPNLSIASRRARRPAKAGDEKDRVLVIDPQKLRQAGLVRLLQDWAARNRLNIIAISSPDQVEIASDCAIVVINIGGDSVLDEGPQLWIKIARSVLAHVPLVIVSDHEDCNEVSAAFEQGARGYIATNLEPAVALEALNFLRHGGSFFPLSAVKGVCQSAPLEGPPLAWNASTVARRTVVRVSARLARWDPPMQQLEDNSEVSAPAPADFPLTPRQLEVLARLREGKPNKLIARDLRMTEATVKVHVRQILRKFGATNRTQAVLCAAGLVAAGSGERST